MEVSGSNAGPLLNLSYEEFFSAVEQQPKPLIIPLCIELPLPACSPPALFAAFHHKSGFLLESCEGSEKIAQYSFVGTSPELMITFTPGGADITGDDRFSAIAVNPDGPNPVDQCRSILQRFHYVNVKAPRFFGGLVGYFSYDMIHSLYPQVRYRDGSGSGILGRFMLAKDCIVFDHRAHRLFLFSSPLITYETDLEEEYNYCYGRICELRNAVLAVRDSGTATLLSDQAQDELITSSLDQPSFCNAVGVIREHIHAGDIFQAVLSRRMECPVRGSAFGVYKALREINPSPYLYYLDFGDEQVVGASPEMLVRVERRKVTTVPIAGTRPRGSSPQEDARLAAELLDDEKERAEHVMLVDLARNDLGRVCRFGSVEVPEFMGVEKFSHVQHIVSTVRGTLQDHLDAFDALKSCFPAGTVSGAPKIRAMQIISELEPDRRGLYAGAVGWMGFDRNLECAIAIRTILIKNGTARVQVGAGIVADSVPANEWIETENKARAMIAAIQRGAAL